MLPPDRREQPGTRVPGRVPLRVGDVARVRGRHPDSARRGQVEARRQENSTAVGRQRSAKVRCFY